VQRVELEAFAAALRDPVAPIPEGLRAPEGAPLEERFAVYRNNVDASLVDVLADRFPVVQALVGEDFFRAMARAYVRLERPRDASLFRYGGTFPAFVAGFEPARSLPYLPDVAALESAWHECWGAAEAEPIGLRGLAAMPAEQLVRATFGVHPAVRLLRSAWPVGSLWSAHRHADPDLAALAWQPENVLITRPQAEIGVRCLDSGTAAFVAALVAGESLERAFDAALAEAPGFEPAPALQQLAGAGLWVEIRPG
jgi:hypothetical protein